MFNCVLWKKWTEMWISQFFVSSEIFVIKIENISTKVKKDLFLSKNSFLTEPHFSKSLIFVQKFTFDKILLWDILMYRYQYSRIFQSKKYQIIQFSCQKSNFWRKIGLSNQSNFDLFPDESSKFWCFWLLKIKFTTIKSYFWQKGEA